MLKYVIISACAVVTYKQEASKLDLDLRMNNHSLIRDSISGKNHLLSLKLTENNIENKLLVEICNTIKIF